MSLRMFRALLALYPRAVRREAGAELLRLYRDQLRQLRRQHRPTGPFVRRALLDLGREVIREHARPVSSFIPRRRSPLARWRSRSRLNVRASSLRSLAQKASLTISSSTRYAAW